MVGPAGSTSEGAFSRTNPGEEDELWEELLLDWAQAMAGGRAANKQ
jgi:hypothetical protein